MPDRDLEKLLGGYATGTLTEEERKALFEAALRDQALFNALENEHALKELLDDPRHRRRLLEALEQAEAETRGGWPSRYAAWLQRPFTWALAGGLAVAILAVTFTVRLIEQVGPPPSATDLVAPSPAPPLSQPEPARIPRAEALTPADRIASGERGKATQPADRKSSKPEQAARPEAQPPAAAVPAPGKPSTPAESFQASGATYSEGKARELFYGRLAGPEPGPGRLAQEPTAGALRAEKTGRADVERKEGEVAKTAVRPLGLRYSLLKRAPDGSVTEVGPDGPLTEGDAFRLTVEPNETGYLYVLRQDASGFWTVLFPQTLPGPEQTAAAARVPGRTRAVIPPAGSLTLEGQPRLVQLSIIFSREPHREFTDLLSSPTRDAGAGKIGGRITAIMDRARREARSQPLLVEKTAVTQPGTTKEQAVYVVNPGPDLSSLLVIELALSGR